MHVAAIPLGLYVHLPWCLRKCPYCDFNSHELRGELDEPAYLDALLADLQFALAACDGRRFATVYFGGGTPSLFQPASIQRLLDILRAGELLAADAEITLEANPGAADEARFAAYRRAGVNRLSLGVQSFNDRCLRALGRVHDGQDARRAAGMVARHFNNFNLDLMYGLPGQSAPDAAADLAQALDTGAPHLSCYQLSIEPNTVFFKRPPPLPDESTQGRIEDTVLKALDEAGFDHYEVSAHARPGRRCAHNLNYWQFGDYLGIGAGAHGKLTTTSGLWRESRLRVPSSYIAAAGGATVIASRRMVARPDRLFEFVLNALRLVDGFSAGLLSARTGLSLQDMREPLDRCITQGLLSVTEGARVRPTASGRRFLDRVVAEFLPH